MSKKWLEEEVRKADLARNFFFEGLKPKEDIPPLHSCRRSIDRFA